MYLAGRVKQLSPSPTLALNARVKELTRQGHQIIDFGVGEPDFDTPANIREEAIAAIREGFTRYTPSAGTPELKEAVCRKLREENGLEYKPAEVLITVGAKHALYNAFLALCDEGDEYILPAPYWVSYAEQIKLAGGRPVVVDTTEEDGFKLTARAFAAHITSRTRGLVLNSPCNPTGAVYTREELAALADVAVRHGLYIIADEIYEKLVYDGAEHVSIGSLGPEVKALTVTINGVSKAYAMTGWRIGYAAAAREIIEAMSDIQSQSTSNPTSISQKAATEALTGPQGAVGEMVAAFDRRRKYMVERLNAMPGVTCQTPAGAFYCFPNFSAHFGRRLGVTEIRDSVALAEAILTEARVAVVPGEAFGADPYLRFSYATSMELIEEGLNRVEEFLSRLE